jgi:hypothetical protein
MNFFFDIVPCKVVCSPASSADSIGVSLARISEATRISRRAHGRRRAASHPVTVHRVREIINGRTYEIDVLSVAPHRWRAQIARTPGGTTALMPFYGATPAEAARLLAAWLDRAGRRPDTADPTTPAPVAARARRP